MYAKSALAIASLALFAQAASAATCNRKYTIKAGDYCDTISAANRVSTYQLAAINADKINVACDNLVPGDELCLGTDEADCQETTVVIAGNTCSAIWSENGLDEGIFYQNNPQVSKDCTNIYIDEVLCVSKTVNVPPAPGVPIHTGPPASEATPPVPLPSSTSVPAEITAAPVNVAPVPTTPPAAAPVPTTPPAAAPAPVPTPDEEECDEEEEEELEVVEGDTDEDLPFCDEL